jgi:hypothetical protein
VLDPECEEETPSGDPTGDDEARATAGSPATRERYYR